MLRALVVFAAFGPLACSVTHSHSVQGLPRCQCDAEQGQVARPQAASASRSHAQRATPEERETAANGALDAALEQELPAGVHAPETPLSPSSLSGTTRSGTSLGLRIAAQASRLVGLSSLHRIDRTVPDDCTGLVRSVYASVDIHLMGMKNRPGDNGVTAIYRNAQSQGAVHRGQPSPGDLVFFRDTYDRNRDGRRNDGLTHVGIVERIEPGGLVIFIHRGSKGVARARMSLRHPAIHRQQGSGEVMNDYIRRASRRQRGYLTGELFAGFASPSSLAKAHSVALRR